MKVTLTITIKTPVIKADYKPNRSNTKDDAVVKKSG